MNLKSVGFHRQLFFFLLLGLGIAYTILLLVFSQKVFSGFAMQFIFLFDALFTHPSNVLKLIFRRDFLTPVVAGSFWIYLLVLALRSLVSLFRRLLSTYSFVQNLKVISVKSGYSVIRLPGVHVFTVGFFHPRIFVTQKLLKTCTQNELTSILLHEQSHVKNFDPLKNLFVDFVSGFLPEFLGKDYLFGQYRTLVEVGCDAYSRSLFAHPTSLVSALLKVSRNSSPSYNFLSHFSAQSERVKVLVGAKKQPVTSLIFANLAMITFLVISASFLRHTDLFYQCQHLALCFQNLFTRDHVVLQSSANFHHCNFN